MGPPHPEHRYPHPPMGSGSAPSRSDKREYLCPPQIPTHSPPSPTTSPHGQPTPSPQQKSTAVPITVRPPRPSTPAQPGPLVPPTTAPIAKPCHTEAEPYSCPLQSQLPTLYTARQPPPHFSLHPQAIQATPSKAPALTTGVGSSSSSSSVSSNTTTSPPGPRPSACGDGTCKRQHSGSEY